MTARNVRDRISVGLVALSCGTQRQMLALIAPKPDLAISAVVTDDVSEA